MCPILVDRTPRGCGPVTGSAQWPHKIPPGPLIIKTSLYENTLKFPLRPVKYSTLLPHSLQTFCPGSPIIISGKLAAVYF